MGNTRSENTRTLIRLIETWFVLAVVHEWDANHKASTMSGLSCLNAMVLANQNRL